MTEETQVEETQVEETQVEENLETTTCPSADLITSRESEDAYFAALVVSMNEKKEEIMTPVPVTNIYDLDLSVLSKKGVIAHMNVWISMYLTKLETIYIQNPILIKTNQDTALEIEESIKNATTSEEANEMQKSLAATLQHIQKLKNEIDPENVSTVLLQHKETIRQLKVLSEKL
jgi:hypothetical protein